MDINHLTHNRRARYLWLAVTGLALYSISIGVVLAFYVMAINRLTVRLPIEYLAKSSGVLVAKNIFVGQYPPNAERFGVGLFNNPHFIPRHEIIECVAEGVVLMRPQSPHVSYPFFRQRKIEIFRNGYGENSCFFPHAKFSSGRISCVKDERFSLKFEVGQSISKLLKYRASYNYSDIGSQCRLIPRFYCFDYILHGLGRPRGLAYMPFHGSTLSFCGLHGLAKFLGLISVHEELQEPNQSERSSLPNHSPIVRRFFLAFICISIGFFGSLWGWNFFDHKGRFIGAALVCLSLLIAWGGLLLFWFALFTWSWAWIV